MDAMPIDCRSSSRISRPEIRLSLAARSIASITSRNCVCSVVPAINRVSDTRLAADAPDSTTLPSKGTTRMAPSGTSGV